MLLFNIVLKLNINNPSSSETVPTVEFSKKILTLLIGVFVLEFKTFPDIVYA